MKAEPTAHPHAREVRHNFSLNRTTMPRFSNWNAALSEIASWLLSTLAARSARAAALRRTARLCLFVRNYCNDDAAWEDVSPKRMAMRVYFSTDGLPPRDRVKFWCDYFARQVHSFTPGEIPDAAAFRAEASGQVAGGFALLDIETGLRGPGAPAPMCRGTRLKQSISDGFADR